MSRKWDKIKNRLEWLELGKTFGDVVAGAGVWKGLKWILSSIGGLQRDGIEAVSFLAHLLLCFCLSGRNKGLGEPLRCNGTRRKARSW